MKIIKLVGMLILAVSTKTYAFDASLKALGLDSDQYLMQMFAPQTVDSIFFHAAVQENDIATVRTLLGNGLDPNTLSRSSTTALYEAISFGHEDMVTLLLEFRASVEAKNGSHQTSALHMAARRGNISILQILLGNGANIMATDAQGNTPMHDAAIGNAPTAIQELCKHGADINAKNIKGETPLHLLMKCCFNLETLLALFANEANPTIVDNKNLTILDIALRNCTEDPRENSIIALITSKQAEYHRWSLLRSVWAGAVVAGANADDTESGDTE
jgi:hypothetical protein